MILVRLQHTSIPAAVAEQAEQGYQVTYECAAGADETERYPIVTLSLDVLLESWVPAIPGSSCPITGATAQGVNAELDFDELDLKLIKAPTMDTLNNLIGRATYEYRKVPSFSRVQRRVVDFPKDAVVAVGTVYQQLAGLGAWTPPAIGDTGVSTFGANYADYYVTSVTIPGDCLYGAVEVEMAKIPTKFTHWGSAGVRFPPLFPAAVSFPPAPAPYPGGRFAFSETVPAKIEYTFSQNPEQLASSMPQTLRFESYLMLAVQDAIENQDLKEEEVGESIARVWWNQADILHETLLIDDPYTGSVVTTSTPSYPPSSTYRAWIAAGTYYITKDTLQHWRGKIHMRVKVSVKAR